MQSEIHHIGVVGSGAMGRGIAQAAALSGAHVVLMDANEETARSAREAIAKALDTEVAKDRLTREKADSALERLALTASLAGLKDVDLVIEAITEDLDAKRSLFAELENAVGADCILASNTSSLSITTLAAACKQPGRVAGMHFFNPVSRMRLVEVIQGQRSNPDVIDALEAVGTAMGKQVVRVQDTPGFLVNQVGRGYTLEAVNLVGEGVATFEQVDRIMRDAAGFRMGPFELLDLVGLDVNHPATEMIYAQFYHEPRYRPSPLMDMRVAAGALGRKNQEGYYQYPAEPKASAQQTEAQPAAASQPCPVWVSNALPDAGQAVRELLTGMGVQLDAGDRPGSESLCVVTPIGRDASHAAAAEQLDPVRTVAIDALFGLTTHRTVMSTCVTGERWREAAASLFGLDGIPVTVVRDSPGFVAQRIVAMIINIGGGLAQARTATAADIDRAVTLGLAYPHGPLSFANSLGAANVLRLLQGLYESFCDPRYRPALWLQRRAVLSLDFLEGD
ncbi:3-hydroxyacyl-CoA dehydrogenase [Pusillimonas sp. MFBS29]|uniref:3-hydroxyacyl-CoA dehydrogenase n=1 Tax=Pusillimonas sp. MFBS29 TaxID=2886690 RepID=UPI001D101889|nr:3-hydroxyacyl-CoA dehydrogenase [Pusillimonas sp. MFBS29]MCC2596168.1 3-hydroxyacyl-CoA dehydrogenase [Pusillimonas sp. MFBS29]